MSEFALLQMKQVLQELLFEELQPFLDPEDMLSMRTSEKIWNVGSKDGPCGELFFFLRQNGPHDKFWDVVSTPFDVREFMRGFRRDALGNRSPYLCNRNLCQA